MRHVKRSAALALVAGATLAASAASAQGVTPGMRMACHDFEEIARQLEAKYKEAPISFGLQTNGNLLQVFKSEQSGSWTIISTTPKGLACILAAGKGWEAIPIVADEPAA